LFGGYKSISLKKPTNEHFESIAFLVADTFLVCSLFPVELPELLLLPSKFTHTKRITLGHNSPRTLSKPSEGLGRGILSRWVWFQGHIYNLGEGIQKIKQDSTSQQVQPTHLVRDRHGNRYLQELVF